MVNYLGEEVHHHLTFLGIETPFKRVVNTSKANKSRTDHLTEQFRNAMRILGLDLTNDSLQDTPKRIAKMYMEEVFYGLNYDNFPTSTTVENGAIKYDEMISCRCSVMSLCEHHFLPFHGTAHTAYIPSTKVLGLSKFNRIVDFFSRRPQVQERLTVQIAASLQMILGTEDVAVTIRAEHMCVKLRGCKDQQSETVTSKVGGKFLSNPTLRQEFLALTRGVNT